MGVDRDRGRWLAAMAAAGNGSLEDPLRGVADAVHDVTLADGVTVIGYVAEYVQPVGRRYGALSLRHSFIAKDPVQRDIHEGWDEASGLFLTQADAAAAVRRYDESEQRQLRDAAVFAIGLVLRQGSTAVEETARQHIDRDASTSPHRPDTATAVLNVLIGLGWTPPPGQLATADAGEQSRHEHGVTLAGQDNPAQASTSGDTSPSRAIGLTMDGEDFDLLCSDGCRWGPHWQRHEERFRVVPYCDEAVSWDWAMSYWVERWCDVMALRAYLDALDEPYQIVSDESMASIEDGAPGFVLLTNYLSPGRGQQLGSSRRSSPMTTDESGTEGLPRDV